MEYVHEFEPIPDSHLLKVFPEAYSICKGLIKEAKRNLCLLDDFDWRWETYCHNKNLPFDKRVNLILSVDIERSKHQRRLTRLEKIVRWKENKDTFANREKALEYPITELLEFNRAGFTKCLWHDEKTASLHYNKRTNRVHCFGCNHNDDAIGVHRKLTGDGFLQSIKHLS